MHCKPVGPRRSPAAKLTRNLGAAALACVLLGSAACSSTPSSSSTATGSATTSAATSAAYCDDIQALRNNVTQLESLDLSNVTPSEVQSIITDAQNNLTKAAQDATGAASVKITAIKTAYSALVAALSSLPSGVSATQAFSQVKPEIAALATAVAAAGAGSGCPSAAGSS
jgi:hypothetical protein